MDAGSRCSKRFQVPERSGDAEALFLCAFAPEFLTRGGFVYPNTPEPGDDGHGADARGARAGRQSCPLRSDLAAGTVGSFDVAAVGGRNFSQRFRWVGSAPRYYRTIWRYVLRSVAKHARAGAAHGAWRRRIQSLASSNVTWLGVDSWRCGPWRGGGAWIDAATREPPIQGEPSRPACVRLRLRGHDHRRVSSVFLTCMARHTNRSSPRAARLIPCIR